MTAQRTRIVLALVAIVVLGATILGIGQGSGPGGGEPAAPSADKKQVVAKRLAALGPVATEGKAVFNGDSGCGGCHTLADADSSGRIGPDLDQTLSDKDLAYVKQSIVDPNAVLEKGFPANLMPGDFARKLSSKQIDDLAKYVHAVTASP